MSVPKTLYEGAPGTTATLLYTTPTTANVRVNTVLAANTTAVAATITVEHVPAGQAPGTGYMFADAVSVAGNTEVSLLPGGAAGEEINLAPGDTLYGLQGTAASINLDVSGEEFDFGAQR